MSFDAPAYGHYADEEGVHYRYCASLRLAHPTADPSGWSESIGLQPELVERVGEPRLRGKFRKQYGVAKCSFFDHQLDAPAESCAFEDFMSTVAAKLEGRKDFLDQLVSDGGDADLFVGFFLERRGAGFFLTPELQRRVGDLHLALNLHIYSCDADEVSAPDPIESHQ